MTKYLKITSLSILLILIALLGTSVIAGEANEEQREIIAKYLEARQATMLLNSTEKDVDKLLDFYTDSIVYEHPRFKMKIEGKANNKKGLVAFLGTTKDTKIVNIKYITGINLVVSEHKITFKSKRGDTWEEGSRTQVTLFEFEGDKISRIVDYW